MIRNPIFKAGCIYEVRIHKTAHGTVSGYFDNEQEHPLTSRGVNDATTIQPCSGSCSSPSARRGMGVYNGERHPV
jgi:hypothetical protein